MNAFRKTVISNGGKLFLLKLQYVSKENCKTSG